MRVPLIGRWPLTFLCLAVILVGACGSSSQATKGNLTLIAEAAFSIDSLDPARSVLPTTIPVVTSIYDTLLTLKPGDLTKPYPRLATSFTVSPDAKTFTFQLRHGVKFASGNPLTSADAVWSLTRLAGIGSPAPSVGMTGLTATAPDPFTVVLTSTTANAAVPILVTQPNLAIVDSKLVQQHGGTTDPNDKAEDYLNAANSAGSGPYMLESFDRTSQVVLKANPMYWGPKPIYTTVILRNVPTATERLDILDGQAQLALGISAVDAASIPRSSVNVATAPSGDQMYLAMNASPSVSPLTADPNFRQAVRYGIDYKGLLGLVGVGATQSSGFIPAGFLGALPGTDAIQRDLPRAKAALAKVGAANPTFEVVYATDENLDGVNQALVATKIQGDLKDVGITINLVGLPLTVLLSKVETNKEQGWLILNPADYPDPSDFLSLTPGNYFAGWFNWTADNDPSTAAQAVSAATAIAPADRAAAYQALGRSWNDKAIFVCLLEPSKVIVSAKSVHAVVNPFYNIEFAQVT